MIEVLNLRDYQREAVDAVQDAHASGMNFPAEVLPPGSGKTVIFAHLAIEHIRDHNNRVLIIVNRDEHADQAIAKILSVAPGLNVGKVKADDDEVFADVVVASVQTVSRKDRLARLVASQGSSPDRRPRQFGLIITDEVHYAAAASYQKVYKAFPGVRRAGFTATLVRGDGVGLGSLIDDVVYRRTWLWMIKHGYLVEPVNREITAEPVDLRDVSRSGGDYAARALGNVMIESGTGLVVARAYLEHASDRPGIAFTPTVAAAYDYAEAFEDAGITAAVVTGETPRSERLEIYSRSRTGSLQVIVNCGVLTHGADFPWISVVVPKITYSEGLYQQMVGRGMRTFPGKADCLVLSVPGVGGKLRTLIDLEPGAVETIRQGESLTEAVERETAEQSAPVAAGARPFVIRHRDRDMFASSRSLWLRTTGGVMFLPVADGEVFLWPAEDGLWDVRHAPRKARRWPRLKGPLSLEMAMAWGETEAEDLETNGESSTKISVRAASWRRKKEPPSPGQVDACAAWGVTVPEGSTKAEVSELLSVRIATLKFDPFVARLARKEVKV